MASAVNSFPMDADSETELARTGYGEVVCVTRFGPAPSVLVVCEHASNRVPASLGALGVTEDVLNSHVAWDPGALGVAQTLAQQVSGILVAGNISRLVYDCNRPPEAASAIPGHSEIHYIPGNTHLSSADRAERVSQVYNPFHAALAQSITSDVPKLLVTVHSFTPVFDGAPRAVELGLLHGRDDKFCAAMLRNRAKAPAYDIRANQPYSAADGVTHTLDLHGAANRLHNVMIEIRNDLIKTPDQQEAMAKDLAVWITSTRDGLSRAEGTA